MNTHILPLRLLCVILASFFMLGGCATHHDPANIPETVKLDIYRDIADTVAAHLQAGDQQVEKDEPYEALTSYKAAYAYDKHREGLQTKIIDLEEKVTMESTKAYERGRGYLETDKERALIEFNTALRLNPAHTEARAAYEKLREAPAIRAKLTELKSQIQREGAAYTASPDELRSLITKNKALLSYDFSDQTALSLTPWLDREKKQQVATALDESEKLFAAGKLDRAKALLKKVQPIAPDNERIKGFLKKVALRQDIRYLLQMARYRLRQHDLQETIIHAGRILELEPKHDEAREILHDALQTRIAQPPTATTSIVEQRKFTNALTTIRQRCLAEINDKGAEKLGRLMEQNLQREIDLLLERGQALYAQKEYTDGHIVFAYVEEIDPGNELAHTFIRKIENRLSTINSLQ